MLCVFYHSQKICSKKIRSDHKELTKAFHRVHSNYAPIESWCSVINADMETKQ